LYSDDLQYLPIHSRYQGFLSLQVDVLKESEDGSQSIQESSELNQYLNQMIIIPQSQGEKGPIGSTTTLFPSRAGSAVRDSCLLRGEEDADLSPRCAPLSMHQSTHQTLPSCLSKPIPVFPVILPTITASVREIHSLTELLPPRPPSLISCLVRHRRYHLRRLLHLHLLLHHLRPLHTVLAQHRLASPPSTTIHAALAAIEPLRFRPSASHLALHLPQLPISRHPGSQSALLTPSCNPHLATSSCCVVHDHATLTSAARLLAYPTAHLAQ
jgi:hypothetical protein